MGDPDWTQAKKFSTLSHRMANAAELDRLIEHWTSKLTAEEVVAVLQEAGIACGVVQNARDLANDPHLQKRGFFKAMEHPILGTVTTDTSPVRFKNMSAPPLKPSPLLGQDNRCVFVDLLGLTEDQYAKFIEKGVIG